MQCPSCRKEVLPDTFFCSWCSAYIPEPVLGARAGVFARWVAWALDPCIAVVLYFTGILVFGMLSKNLGVLAAALLPIAYLVWFLRLLRQGLTPGKRLLGLQVVRSQTGQVPGLGTMFVREFVGRFLSALVFGLGYLWALFDRNGQAWHDKLAGTVVVKVNRQAAMAPTRGSSLGAGAV